MHAVILPSSNKGSYEMESEEFLSCEMNWRQNILTVANLLTLHSVSCKGLFTLNEI